MICKTYKQMNKTCTRYVQNNRRRLAVRPGPETGLGPVRAPPGGQPPPTEAVDRRRRPPPGAAPAGEKYIPPPSLHNVHLWRRRALKQATVRKESKDRGPGTRGTPRTPGTRVQSYFSFIGRH